MRSRLKLLSSCFALLFFTLSAGPVFSDVGEIDPSQLQSFMKKHPGTQLIDVREGWERSRAKLPKSQHIPMGEITSAVDKLDMEKPVITYCKTGRRSRHAAEVLEKIGFKEVYNIRGGIEAYSIEVDSTIPRY